MNKINEITVKGNEEALHYKKIGNGMCGNCYLTSDGKLYKEFLNDGRFDGRYSSLKYISEQYRKDHLVLPETFVYLDDESKKLIGYIREFVNGKSFEELPKDINMRKFILAFSKLEKEMVENIKYGLTYADLHVGNILYTSNDEIKVIDQDLYFIDYEGIKDKFIDAMYDLYCILKISLLKEYKDTDKEASEIIGRSYYAGDRNFIRPSVMLEMLIDYLEKKHAYNINSFNDLEMGLKLTK